MGTLIDNFGTKSIKDDWVLVPIVLYVLGLSAARTLAQKLISKISLGKF